MRKALILPALALVLLAGCTPQETEQAVEFEHYTIEQFLKTTSVGGGSFSPDESKLLVHSNATGVFNIYSIDVATGEMTQLTNSEDTTFSIGYLPNDERFLFTRDSGGNEINKLYLMTPDGEVTQLTQGENTRELFYGYAQDLNSFFTGNNSRDQKFIDVYKWDIETLTPELFYQNNDGLNLTAISRDERWVALVKTNNDFDSDMYLVDREGDATPVMIGNVEGEEVNFFPQDFTPDGSKLLYTTDKGSEFTYLMSYDIATGDVEEVYRAEWNVTGVGFSYDGTYRVISVNENATTRLSIVNTMTGEELRLPEMPDGDITGLSFSRSENLMRFYVIDDRMPSNLFVYNIENKEAKRLTNNLNPEIEPANLVDAEFVEMTARDGLTFWGYLYQPKQATAENKVPALLWIHGGPGGQSRPTYSAEKQFLANHGYAVFDLNYRGSGGFGRTFSMADDQKHGQEPLYDCIDAKNYLIDNIEWVDSERIGILGGSYGGYMVMAAMAFAPEEFEVGVNIFGVTNWLRTLKSIPPWWESFRLALYREIGNPETQEAMLLEISPLFHADKVKKPVMVLQGANDPRVLQVESDEMVQNIKDAGGIVEYVLFDDEGHGFRKTENRVKGWNAILGFLDTYLKGEIPPVEEDPEVEGAEEEAAN